jgi:outer membrane protein, heavy metal efflux system
MPKLYYTLIVCCLWCAFDASGVVYAAPGDTLHIKLNDAEQLFLKNNLTLLAQKYNVDAVKAQIIQAKLFQNPSISFAQGIYNPNGSPKYFNVGSGGEESGEIDKEIHLAGQRNKNIKVANYNYQISEYGFYDLMRTLKYTLRSDFFDLYFLIQSDKIYDNEIKALRDLTAVYNVELPKGFVSRDELLRLQAQLISLQGERIGIHNSIEDKQQEMALLLHTDSAYLIPDVNTDSINAISAAGLNYQQLLQTADSNRFDMKASQMNIQLQQENLSLQRSTAVPDLQIGVAYDKAGSYIPNYNALTLGFDIPIFNRNQGSIAQAKDYIQASQLQFQSKQDSVTHQVETAYRKTVEADRVYNTFPHSFASDYSTEITGVLENFKNRNISMLQFLDFYDSYKQSMVELYQLQSNRMDAFETLNYATGKTLFPY